MTDDTTAGSAPIADPAQNTVRPRILIAGGGPSPLRAMAVALIARLSMHVEVLDTAPASYGPAQKGKRGKQRRW